MRLMLKFIIPVEKGNEAAANGEIESAILAMIDQVKPEAAYFTLEDGKRAGMVIFETTDPVRLTEINEPMFAKLNAAIWIVPVLTLEDLRKGLPKK